MGDRVCKWLDGAGYALCDGDVMANNPKWCKSLPGWKEDFSDWMMKADPQELLDLNICLDFRSVFRKARLAHELCSYIYSLHHRTPNTHTLEGIESLQKKIVHDFLGGAEWPGSSIKERP